MLSNLITKPATLGSQKPQAIYKFIEQFCPSGEYLELFARPNNLRDGYISVGNEDLSSLGIRILEYENWIEDDEWEPDSLKSFNDTFIITQKDEEN